MWMGGEYTTGNVLSKYYLLNQNAANKQLKKNSELSKHL